MNLPLAAVFADLPDPRRETANKRHTLTDILVLATCAVNGGCDTWDDIAEYAETKGDFFRRFTAPANGIPSADTFSRVFAEAFGRWMAAACGATGLVPVAVDGKAARSAPAHTAAGRLTVVSAWACENRLNLGQVVVQDGVNDSHPPRPPACISCRVKAAKRWVPNFTPSQLECARGEGTRNSTSRAPAPRNAARWTRRRSGPGASRLISAAGPRAQEHPLPPTRSVSVP